MAVTKSDIEYMPLSDDTKNELVIKHQRIVHYFAHRYKHLANGDLEEVRAWAYFGLAQAIKVYETKRDNDLSALAFPRIKTEIFLQAAKIRQTQNVKSMNAPVGGDAETSPILENLIADPTGDTISEIDIYRLVVEALFEEGELSKKVNIDYLFHEKGIDEIAEECRISPSLVKKIYRRGKTLIKVHLMNNDYIVSGSVVNNKRQSKRFTEMTHMSKEEVGQMKYIYKHFPFLTSNDISKILNVSPYVISKTTEYPTADYIKTGLNPSIKTRAENFIKVNYPNHVAGEVHISRLESV
ncbi:hypothetical protein [Bacillus sp. AG4(2022)]|uniref:hypothetical protein n=1 Tax=Bacillus sp. AG4(2022) TaxID=2962594 RepID=UPI002881A96A|nr:hypothetical protein [Bacillus sp. AG4(2022)]MDT0163833.1 hypothetical protein [Bacillus sp. AG4(2022)]